MIPIVTSQPPAEPRTVWKAAIVMSDPVSIFAGSVCHAEHSGGSNRKSGNRTYNNGIPEGSGHIDISLADRIVCRCGRCCNCGRTHAGFVRKDTTGNTISHGTHHGCYDGTTEAAADSLYRKCHLKNHRNACRQIRNISDNDNNDHRSHKKSPSAGTTTEETFRNGFDTADNDQQGQAP